MEQAIQIMLTAALVTVVVSYLIALLILLLNQLIFLTGKQPVVENNTEAETALAIAVALAEHTRKPPRS